MPAAHRALELQLFFSAEGSMLVACVTIFQAAR